MGRGSPVRLDAGAKEEDTVSAVRDGLLRRAGLRKEVIQHLKKARAQPEAPTSGAGTADATSRPRGFWTGIRDRRL